MHEWEHNRRLCRPRGPLDPRAAKDDANAKARETNAEEDVVGVVVVVVFPERALNALTTQTHKGGLLLDTKIHLDKSTYYMYIFRTQKRQAFSKRTPHYTTKVGEKSDEKEDLIAMVCFVVVIAAMNNAKCARKGALPRFDWN